MANDLATLAGYLDTMLNDSSNVAWGNTEKEELITWAVAELYPRVKRILDPSSSTISLAADTYLYSLPTGCLAVSKLFLLNDDGDEVGFVSGDAWELTGDPLKATGQIHISPILVSLNESGTLRVYGYGRYDVTTNLILDEHVQLVLAHARHEAYRRLVGDRARFKAWLSRQQTQNVSVNEAIQIVNEAENQYERLRSGAITFMKPMPGRQ